MRNTDYKKTIRIVKTLWPTNLSRREICDVLGFRSHKALLYWVDKLGLPRRPWGRPEIKKTEPEIQCARAMLNSTHSWRDVAHFFNCDVNTARRIMGKSYVRKKNDK